MSLPDLIRAAGAIDGLERLRLSSIEINHVTPELIDAMRETPVASRHLHVPLQSGDDAVLEAMGRRYTVRPVPRAARTARDFNLTTDAIVGFPAEDDAPSRGTLEVVSCDRDHEGPRLPVFAAAGTRTAAAIRSRRRSRKNGERVCGPPRTRHAALVGRVGSAARPRARRPAGPRLRRRLHALARRCSVGSVVARAGGRCLNEGVLAVVAA